MKIEDSLDREQNSYIYTSNQGQTANSKQAIQNLYRQQLDQLMQEKNKQKELEKNREMRERKQFNDRANSNKESERFKEQAYKNYYNILRSNQEQLQSSYVSPFSVRDGLKEQLISQSLEESEQKRRKQEQEERIRHFERKNMYRSQLMNQIEERKKIESLNKEQQQRKKQQYRKYGQLPQEIIKYERQRQLQEMAKYRQDLDRVKNEKQFMRGRIKSEEQNTKLGTDQHNTLINPLPYNIQNPYILREMNKQSYLASRGHQNFANAM